MANNLAVLDSAKLPSFLRAEPVSGFTAALASSLAGGGFPVLSIKGKEFAVVRKQERKVLTVPGDDDTAAGSVLVVIVNANTHLSKTYYKAGYEEGGNGKPDCMSNNGKSPDASVESPVSKNCATCPKNAWNSGANGKGKACQDTLRVAVSPAGQINDPMLLRVPPGSLKNAGEYFSALNKRGLSADKVITKIKFAHGEATPKLEFSYDGFVTEAQWEEVQEVRDSDTVHQIIGVAAVVEEFAGEPNAAPAPAPKKAAPKVAAADNEVSVDEVDDVLDAPPTKAKKPAKPAPVVDSADDLADAIDGLLSASDD